MNYLVSAKDIEKGFDELGIIGHRVLIHSSLSSFGHVEGGADTVVDVIINSFKTILMPAFCWDSNTTPPTNDRPIQNGCVYSFYDNWNRPPKPFLVESAGIEKSLGVISKRFIAMPGVFRSDHPWHSWAAYGDAAEQLVENHSWETTNMPIERLADLGADLLLLGVGLNSCTAIHVAEERIGRRPFIRWATDRNGKTKRVRVSGCGKGFNNLMPYCEDLFLKTYISKSRVLTTPLKPFIAHVASIIASKPELTRCSPTCIRCRDAILGGPIE